jgi:hypothetical protein
MQRSFGPNTMQNDLQIKQIIAVQEIAAERLPVRCETNRTAGAIGRDRRACQELPGHDATAANATITGR